MENNNISSQYKVSLKIYDPLVLVQGQFKMKVCNPLVSIQGLDLYQYTYFIFKLNEISIFVLNYVLLT